MSVKIYGRRETFEGRQKLISDAVHNAMHDILGTSADDRVHRFIVLEAENLVAAQERASSCVVIEVLLVLGCSAADKEKLVTSMYRNLALIDNAPTDTDIVITEVPPANVGVRGRVGLRASLVDRPPPAKRSLRDTQVPTSPSQPQEHHEGPQQEQPKELHQAPTLSSEATNGSTDLTKVRNTGHRHARDYWNQGQFRPIRIGSDLLHHKPSSSGANSKVRRCIVCCESCKTGRTHHRRGYKTKFGCYTCAQMAATAVHESVKDAPLLPLCQIPRFKSQNEPRTCFAIHHSGDPYPQLSCSAQDRPRAAPQPPSMQANKRLKSTRDADQTSSSPQEITDERALEDHEEVTEKIKRTSSDDASDAGSERAGKGVSSESSSVQSAKPTGFYR